LLSGTGNAELAFVVAADRGENSGLVAAMKRSRRGSNHNASDANLVTLGS
jgi:hypothetical protein